MMLRPTLSALALIAALPLAAAETPADAAPSLDVEAMTCRALLQTGGNERDLLLAFLHGYAAAKAGTGAPGLEAMATLTDQVIDRCIDAPNQRVLDAFQADAKS